MNCTKILGPAFPQVLAILFTNAVAQEFSQTLTDRGKAAATTVTSPSNKNEKTTTLDGSRAPLGSANDTREAFSVTGYSGLAIDTFAADSLKKYLNPEVSGEAQERFIIGFKFEYRVFRWDKLLSSKLWVYGRTLHGARSAEIDCANAPDSAPCQTTDGGNLPTGKSLFILRNARSLEGNLGIRFEFLPLQQSQNGGHPAIFYLKSEMGFLSVANGGSDIIDQFKYLALGITATSGRFKSSYVEFGLGKTELFLGDFSTKRKKIDAQLSFDLPDAKIKPFLQMYVDSDFGRGSDSIQTYIGIDFDIPSLFESVLAPRGSSSKTKD